MPTIKFLEEQESSSNLPRDHLHGFQNEFFAPFDNVMKALQFGDNGLDPEDTDQITSKLLRTGPCPGNARVYYKLTEAARHPSTDELVTEFLGDSIDEELTRQELGVRFERWVDAANEAINEWLEDQDSSHIEELDIPQPIKEFYLERLDNISSLSDELDIPLRDLEMTIDQVYSSQYFYPADPDGAWLLTGTEGTPGGVFESKLSKLPNSVDKHYLTGYAAYIERDRKVPVEIGVYLYTDDENNSIDIDSFYINQNFRSEIRENLSKFATLVQQSKENDEWEDGSLEDRLIEPPEPETRPYCSDCLYQEVCHGE